MAQTMTFTAEQINSFKVNGIIYGDKLLNQSREVDKIVENISSGWKGSEAMKCMEALRATSADYKRVAKDIEPLNDAIKVTLDKLKDVHGDV